MAVIFGTGHCYFWKICGLRNFAIVLAVLFGTLGFSFGDSSKSCDVVKRDFETTARLTHLRFLEKPETGKKFQMFLSMSAFVFTSVLNR